MNNTLEYRGYITEIKYSASDKCLYGKIEHIKDLIMFEAQDSKGIEEAFHCAVDEYIQECEEDGISPDVTCKGTFNVRIGADLHRAAVYEASRRGVSLNDLVKDAVQSSVNSRDQAVLTHKHEHTVRVIRHEESVDIEYDSIDDAAHGPYFNFSPVN